VARRRDHRETIAARSRIAARGPAARRRTARARHERLPEGPRRPSRHRRASRVVGDLRQPKSRAASGPQRSASSEKSPAWSMNSRGSRRTAATNAASASQARSGPASRCNTSAYAAASRGSSYRVVRSVQNATYATASSPERTPQRGRPRDTRSSMVSRSSTASPAMAAPSRASQPRTLSGSRAASTFATRRSPPRHRRHLLPRHRHVTLLASRRVARARSPGCRVSRERLGCDGSLQAGTVMCAHGQAKLPCNKHMLDHRGTARAAPQPANSARAHRQRMRLGAQATNLRTGWPCSRGRS
jgi:hypothetical protein